ncbi:hypothetical protein BDR26DRAFT_859081 [Obelidium mucronatum]|nr:hypothetical protein BDR26DRAFT_859081 [Obelidium mucronatum]
MSTRPRRSGRSAKPVVYTSKEEDDEEEEEEEVVVKKSTKTTAKRRRKSNDDSDSEVELDESSEKEDEDDDEADEEEDEEDGKKSGKKAKSTKRPATKPASKKLKKTAIKKEEDDDEKEEDDDDDDDDDEFKAGPGGIPSRDQMKAILTANAKQLKAALQRNDQIQSGTKAEMQARIVACIQEGCFPKCPKCATGRLRPSKFKNRNGNLECPGHMDDEGKFNPCGYWQGREEYLDLVVVRPEWIKADGQDI